MARDAMRAASPVGQQTAPIVWGGIGVDAQHSVFQLLHQGTHLVPAEFLFVLDPTHSMLHHHRALLTHCIAQSASLMHGRGTEEASLREAGDDKAPARLAAAKTFAGDRPSSTIVLQRITPETLGALIAFYEHRCFACGALWGLNSFDQMGVELGKEFAQQVNAAIVSENYNEIAFDSSTRKLLDLVKNGIVQDYKSACNEE